MKGQIPKHEWIHIDIQAGLSQCPHCKYYQLDMSYMGNGAFYSFDKRMTDKSRFEPQCITRKTQTDDERTITAIEKIHKD